ncbi:MAG: UDP-N-acetyl-D-mannosamine dehydrogenase [Pseudomonadota bacterium]|nr:UDP-N-acetyl-D-mannosamine dehydrogenase [Pseudomonadota bacterium]
MSSRQHIFKTVSVIGLGYIGLPTAALIASRGVRVQGVDINPRVAGTISEGRVHIAEPDLDGLVQKVVSSGMLTARTQVEPADAFIIAVPTPIRDDQSPDVSYVEKAAEAIAPHLRKGNLVIVESTVPVGTTELIASLLARLRPDFAFPLQSKKKPDIHMAYCPERVLPGRVLTELIHNDRCIGGLTPRCSRRACELYRIFLEGECFETNARTAELVKLTENAFRDVNIAFANELSLIADKLGIDVWELIALANRHPRVNILQPGPGVGGHCIAIDPWFIVHSAPNEARMIRTAREINESKPDFVLRKVKEAANGNKHPRIACLGLAFKPNVDDMRNSPALSIVEKLAEEHGDRIIAVEPYIDSLPEDLSRRGARLMDALSAIDQSDIVLLLVDHRQFRMIDVNQISGKTIIDTKGLWHH